MRAVLTGSAAYRNDYNDIDIIADQEFLEAFDNHPDRVIEGCWGKTYAYPVPGKMLEITVPKEGTAYEMLLTDLWKESTPTKILGMLRPRALPIEAIAAMKRAHLTLNYHWDKHIIEYGRLKDRLGVKFFNPKDFGMKIERLYRLHAAEVKAISKAKPKLDQSKDAFFGETEYEIFDHDSTHVALAYPNVPAYTLMKDGEVWCSREKWKELPEREKLRCVIEEASVLALERSVIPALFLGRNYNGAAWAFRTALEKMSVGIVSGFFAIYTIENYREAIAANFDYVTKFFDGLKSGMIKVKKPEVVYGTK